MALQFLTCTLTDADQLRALATRSYTPYYAHLWEEGGLNRYLANTYHAETLAAELSDPNVFYEMALHDGVAVAFSKSVRRCNHATSMNAAYLERVYVVPEMLGRRVGQALIERVIERARRDGRTKVWLQAMVEASAPLRRYHELGFTVCGSTTLVQPSVRADRAAMQILVKDLTDP